MLISAGQALFQSFPIMKSAMNWIHLSVRSIAVTVKRADIYHLQKVAYCSLRPQSMDPSHLIEKQVHPTTCADKSFTTSTPQLCDAYLSPWYEYVYCG